MHFKRADLPIWNSVISTQLLLIIIQALVNEILHLPSSIENECVTKGVFELCLGYNCCSSTMLTLQPIKRRLADGISSKRKNIVWVEVIFLYHTIKFLFSL